MLLIEPNSATSTCGSDCLSISINVKYKTSKTSEERYKWCTSASLLGKFIIKRNNFLMHNYEQGPHREGNVTVHRFTEEL